MMRKFLLLLLPIFLVSCFENDKKYKVHENLENIRKPISWGHEQKIYVVSQDKVWNNINNDIRDNLSRMVLTTDEERYFDIEKIDFAYFEDFYKFKNLLFIANVNDDTEVTKYLHDLLGDDIFQQVKTQKAKVLVKTNLWANDQYLMFLLGTNNKKLIQLHQNNQEKIFDLFAKRLQKRLEFQAYKTQIHSMNLFKELDYEIPIPESYRIYRQRPEERFMSFLNRLDGHPDKYISIYYEQISLADFDKDWLQETRQKLSWKYYDEDYFEKDAVEIAAYKLGNHPSGLKLWGRWQNKKYTVGGAFQTFAFYDENLNTAFLIDNSVYFPQGYKLKALIELEQISKNIKIKSSQQ